MQIQSMTGYGSGTADGLRVEVRSTNHRGLYIKISVPTCFYHYEPEIRNLVKERFHRGHIEILLSKFEGNNLKLKLNETLAKEYYHALITLKNKLSLNENVGINVLALQKDIFSLEESDVEILIFRKAFEAALDELKKMRIKEGKNLVNDITKRIHFLNDHIALIEGKRKGFITNARAMLTEKLKDILGNTSIDDSRLIQEVAILIEKSDITEEIVRMKSHLNNMESILKHDDVIGKKIGFLTQELHRELNTIGSKSANAEISTIVVEMKNELEKIREQGQNLE